MKHSLRTVVVPAAGLGTRFLPATKAVPKEMLPIVDVPTIQLIVDEAVKAGAQQVVLVNGRGKGAIEDHFDRSYELEDTLARKNKRELFEQVRRISEMVRLLSIRQKEPMGLGHAVLAARPAVGAEQWFGVLLGDDLIDSEEPAIGQLARVAMETGKAAVALMPVPDDQTHTVRRRRRQAARLAATSRWRRSSRSRRAGPRPPTSRSSAGMSCRRTSSASSSR